MSAAGRAWIFLFLAVPVAMAGCSRSPEAKKARHLDRGDRYFAREQYHEAVIEYANVLRIDRVNMRAIQQLALSHYQPGELAQAFPYFVQLQELAPETPDVHLKLGTIDLLSRKREKARQEAAAVLRKDPKKVEAPRLLPG